MTGSTTSGATARLADGTATGRWVLDPAGSTAEFRVRHFWGAITVRGTLKPTAGEAAVGPDGAVTGRISFDARSPDTGHKQRDQHLRSADFFHADQHPEAVLTVTSARAASPDGLECHGTLDVAGQAVVLTAGLQVDRAEFGMTWSPLRMASMTALGTVQARFTRA